MGALPINVFIIGRGIAKFQQRAEIVVVKVTGGVFAVCKGPLAYYAYAVEQGGLGHKGVKQALISRIFSHDTLIVRGQQPIAVSDRALPGNKGGYLNLPAQEFQLPVAAHGFEQVWQEALPAERVVGVDIFVEVVVVFVVHVEARIFPKGPCPEENKIRRVSGR